mgnify:CR=1 FL=1
MRARLFKRGRETGCLRVGNRESRGMGNTRSLLVILAVGSAPTLAVACSVFGSDAAESALDGAVDSSNTLDSRDAGVLDGMYPPDRLAPDASRSLKLSVVETPKPAIRGKEPCSFKVRLDPLGSKAVLVADMLPQGLSMAESTIEPTTGEGEVIVVAAASVRAGTYDVTIRAQEVGTALRAEVGVRIEVRGAPGEVDETFGTNGYVVRPASVTSEVIADAALLSDGKFVTGGVDEEGPFVKRYSSEGVLDATFGIGGTYRFEPSYRAAVSVTALQAQGTAFVVATRRNQPAPTGDVGFFRFDGASVTKIQTLSVNNMRTVQAMTAFGGASNAIAAVGVGGAGWVVASFDARTGALSPWGNGGSGFAYSGAQNPGLALFSGVANDYVIVAESGVRGVVLSKAGVVQSEQNYSLAGSFLGGDISLGASDTVHFAMRTPSGTFGLFGLNQASGGKIGSDGPLASGSLSGVPQHSFVKLRSSYLVADVGVRVARVDVAGNWLPIGDSPLMNVAFPMAAGVVLPVRLLPSQDQGRAIVVGTQLFDDSFGINDRGLAMTRIWL